MPRTFRLSERDYAPGDYGPFSVDGFTRNDTEYLELTFTVTPSWPVSDALITGTIFWDTGAGGGFTIPSPPRNRDGTLRDTASLRLKVHRVEGGKANVASGTVSLTLAAPIRTAITLAAV